jgi:hypothetical protein
MFSFSVMYQYSREIEFPAGNSISRLSRPLLRLMLEPEAHTAAVSEVAANPSSDPDNW